MQEMVDRNSKGIMMFPSLVSAQTVSNGGHVIIGVPKETVINIFLKPEKYYIALYVVDKKEFDEIKNS